MDLLDELGPKTGPRAKVYKVYIGAVHRVAADADPGRSIHTRAGDPLNSKPYKPLNWLKESEPFD